MLDVYPPEYWPCNYFNRLDNAPDLGHVHFAHRDSREAASTVTGIATVLAEETNYGIKTSMPMAPIVSRKTRRSQSSSNSGSSWPMR